MRYLATILRCEIAFIARCEPQDPGALRILARYFDGNIDVDLPHSITGTPCETVLGQVFRAYPRGLRERFADDEGLTTQAPRATPAIP